MIARGLEISLDELVDGTDAKAAVDEEEQAKARAWCLNQHCPKAIVDVEPADPKDTYGKRKMQGGEYIYAWTHDGLWHGVRRYASFSAFNQSGEPVNYCPGCGRLLIQRCPSCERLIENSARRARAFCSQVPSQTELSTTLKPQGSAIRCTNAGFRKSSSWPATT